MSQALPSTTEHPPPCAEPYESQLNLDPQWALLEGSRHFEETNNVFRALNKVASRLRALNVPFAVLGDLAMFRHGYRRFTEVIELLLTREGLRTVHDQLIGNGYALDRPHSRSIRDTEFGVKTLVSVAGDFPGDNKPKPVSFPDPSMVAVNIAGISCVNLATLFELKLASAKLNVLRHRNLGDAIDLIRILKLPREFGAKLNPYVQDEYYRFWDAIAASDEPNDRQESGP